MNSSKKLLNFFRHEFRAEEKSGFARLQYVPDSRVASKLRYYKSLDKADRAGFADYCAHLAHNSYSFVLGAAKLHIAQHPFYSKEKEWLDARASNTNWNAERSVPLLRAMVQQYKIDRHRRTPSSVSKEQFEYASSVRSVKAPELRKRVRNALIPLGYFKTDEQGFYLCRQGHRKFRVGVDFRGRYAQLRYVVARPEFRGVHPMLQFGFERALGFGRGDWDFIVEENVDDVFALFANVVKYSFELPDRIREEAV